MRSAVGPSPSSPPTSARAPIAIALRRALRKGYGLADLKADAMAGIVVGIVALPLSMALAIAVGAPPQHGLYTAIVAGAATALTGGCKFQVTGPTAAFIVILAPIVHKYGLSGLMTASVLAGLILVVLGVARLGNLIRFIPYPVTTGFTTGIAVVIATLQLKDVFGLHVEEMPDHYVEKLQVLFGARGSARLSELAVAASTFALLVGIPRVIKQVPAPLIAITLVSGVVAALRSFVPSFSVATIGTRFRSIEDGVEVAGIPQGLPVAALPWGGGLPEFEMITELMGPAFAIAMLGAIESLLSAVIADGMTNTKHDPNAELVGQGIGNILGPMFGGIAATGALARTATNIRAGARSPLASVAHAVFILLSILLLAPLVAYVPMASLAALLLLVAWNMSEARHFVHVVRVAPRSDVFVLLTCFFLTVFFDMVVAVAVGFMLAAILFMKRMSELTESHLTLDASENAGVRPPKGVVVYEINGPLFFGAAQKAMATLTTIQAAGRAGSAAGGGDDAGGGRDAGAAGFSVLVLHLGRVSVIDASGFVALENAIERVVRQNKHVVLAGPLPRPQTIFDKAKLEAKLPNLHVAPSLEAALARATELVAVPVAASSRPSVAPRSEAPPTVCA